MKSALDYLIQASLIGLLVYIIIFLLGKRQKLKPGDKPVPKRTWLYVTILVIVGLSLLVMNFIGSMHDVL